MTYLAQRPHYYWTYIAKKLEYLPINLNIALLCLFGAR
jgi:hypothetical protein